MRDFDKYIVMGSMLFGRQELLMLLTQDDATWLIDFLLHVVWLCRSELLKQVYRSNRSELLSNKVWGEIGHSYSDKCTGQIGQTQNCSINVRKTAAASLYVGG